MRRATFILWVGVLGILTACTSTSPTPPNEETTYFSFVSPSKDLLTNQNVVIHLEVRGPQTTIQLYLNDKLLTTLNPPYEFSWDTSDWPCGNYKLEARVGNQSQVRNVILDHLAPIITKQEPLPEAKNVWLNRTITVEFNEAIDSASVNAENIKLLDKEGKVLNIESRLEYKQLSITLQALPTLPNTLTLHLNQLSDLAGNSLTTSSWSWSVSDWQTLGASLNISYHNANEPALALNASENPVVAWEENTHIYVKQWKGNAWQLLGDKLNQRKAANPAIATYQDHIFVAWAEGETQANIYVKTWDGQSWISLGDAVDSLVSNDTAQPALAIDKDGKLYVTWFEFDGTSSNVYAKHWNGQDWESLGQALDHTLSQNAVFPSITVVNSTPVVTWFERQNDNAYIYVKRWNNNNWEALGSALNTDSSRAFNPSIAADDSGNIYVSWFESKGNYSVFVKRWNGQSWGDLGEALDVTLVHDAAYPVIGWRNNRLFVSWFEMSDTDNLCLKEWNGSSWQVLNAPKVSSESFATYPSLALDSDGNPVLAWRESDAIGQYSKVYAHAFNGLAN